MKKVLFIVAAIGVAGVGAYLFMKSKTPVQNETASGNTPTSDKLLSQIKSDIESPKYVPIYQQLFVPVNKPVLYTDTAPVPYRQDIISKPLLQKV